MRPWLAGSEISEPPACEFHHDQQTLRSSDGGNLLPLARLFATGWNPTTAYRLRPMAKNPGMTVSSHPFGNHNTRVIGLQLKRASWALVVWQGSA